MGNPAPKSSVQEHWYGRLPEAQRRLYDSIVTELESCYAMLSVVLDEAFASRSRGRLPRAREEAAVAAALFDRLSARLLAALGAVADQSKYSEPVPDVTPLNPDFFRREWAQRAAAWNHVLHHISLGTRARFMNKVHALDGTVGTLAGEFRETAGEISEGLSVRPGDHWHSLDSLHYDVNTCLRETIVILKSFLYGLPDTELDVFEQRLEGRRHHVEDPGSPHRPPTPRSDTGAWR